MEWRKNQGFIIVNQITIGGAEFVLGVHEKNPNSFVTWKCKGKDDYYWGHYFTNLLAAQKICVSVPLKKSRLSRL